MRNVEEINHPDHYNIGIECTDYIKSWDMNFVEGNIIKYVTRYRYKNGLKDLLKAQWYINDICLLISKRRCFDLFEPTAYKIWTACLASSSIMLIWNSFPSAEGLLFIFSICSLFYLTYKDIIKRDE